MKVIFYKTKNNKIPFKEWVESLDAKVQTIVDLRLSRIMFGNFGDCKPIVGAKGILELRIQYGAGYRVYFGRDKTSIIVLLIGGDKGSQSRDIEKARRYWLDYKQESK
ncbi:type II toxin-antitoxin system RelE/ParE family toxin [Candidatus Dependentiae bacterium]|nr:type II toxin-antitoxin system RelE/ParE family toxin [Candidatus Dependentiae bacterium]